MRVDDFPAELTPMPAAMPAWRATVDTAMWRRAAQDTRDKGGRLVALWVANSAVHMTLTIRSGLVWLTLPLTPQQLVYPDVSDIFPAANRMQRAAFDMVGVRADGRDQRRWLRHGAWPEDQFPLSESFDGTHVWSNSGDDYAFVQVTGEGVHEIPVGPVHAGTIEPGHFRFSVVGERVLRLEQRLGYKHKGVEKRFESFTVQDGYRLAGRISGDSTVAYAWAYAMAAESAAILTPPLRALWLRALLLERERIANHLGDLGFLGNDAGLAFGLAQLSRLKEDVLRTNLAFFGHRYLMDVIVPGGVACDLSRDGAEAIRREIDRLRPEVDRLKTIFDEHPGLQDRLISTGRVAPELADKLGLVGLAGRASGMAWDLRAQLPTPPYDQLDVRMATHRNGDVAARVTVRFEEVLESFKLCAAILDRLPAGEIRSTLATPAESSIGVGWVEGWRGEVLIALETGSGGSLRRVHAHDPSWQNWPVLEHAVIGNIVPDFPLINKSFNLSYSGVDL
jgi:Ni,Fe-hydrogenase III large subunit